MCISSKWRDWWKRVVTDILDLANELKERTIEKVISKSDMEMGLSPKIMDRW